MRIVGAIKRAVFDLACENVPDQLAELNWIARAEQAFVCCHATEYGMKTGTFKGRVKRPDFQTGPLPERARARVEAGRARQGPRRGRA